MISFGVVLLAAGGSRRMGTPKLLLPWDTTSVLDHLIRQWNQQAVGQIGIVCAPANRDVLSELDRLAFPGEQRIMNPTPDEGMFSSIQCAARWTGWEPDLTHWLITLGDQPHLRADTLRALLECGRANPDKACQPLHLGKRRHPVLLPEKLFRELKDTAAPDLKQFLLQHPYALAGFNSDDPGLALDMDTPADYELLRQRYFPAGSGNPSARRAINS